MRASKEQSEVAKVNLEKIVRVMTKGAVQVGSEVTDAEFREAVSRAEDLAAFLNAAKRKLPTEKAYNRDARRRAGKSA